MVTSLLVDIFLNFYIHIIDKLHLVTKQMIVFMTQGFVLLGGIRTIYIGINIFFITLSMCVYYQQSLVLYVTAVIEVSGLIPQSDQMFV